MILSKTPVRIAFGGGGTDVEPYSSDYGGYVINVTINNYIRTALTNRDDDLIKIFANEKISTYNLESINDLINQVQIFDLIDATVYFLKPKIGIEIYIKGEPPKKAGLGASASLCTCLIAGIMKLENKNKNININKVAEQAYRVEDEVLKNIGGRQDQYASVYGGFNELEFLGGSKVKINGLKLSASFKQMVEENLILFATGDPHTSGNLVKKQVKSYLEKKEQAKKYLDKLKEIAYEMKDCLLSEDFELFGKKLTEDWKIKSEFNPFLTTDYMRELNKFVMDNGGIGGRVCGAGGGGCFLWLVNPQFREKVIKYFNSQRGRLINFKFVNKGLEIKHF